jgi:tripartite-type tricarboxylate transporter receptor subunit TctC
MKRISHLLTLIGFISGFALTPAAMAQTEAFPSRPIRLIVPFPPGGGADFAARTIANAMGASIGQPVVVENRAGASGMIGAEAAAKSAPDGHTVLLIDRGALCINPHLYGLGRYDPLNSFAYIGTATEAPYVLVVHPSSPAISIGELVELAKRKPDSLSYGSFGIGSMPHLNIEGFDARLGIKMQHVPYKGAGEAVNAVVNGEVQVALVSPPSVLGFLNEGGLRALAVGAKERIAQLPDVPTLAEAGLPTDLLMPTFFALAAPAGTPAAAIRRINAELKRAVALPDVVAKLAAGGLLPVGDTPEELSARVARDFADFGTLVRSFGIKVE